MNPRLAFSIAMLVSLSTLANDAPMTDASATEVCEYVAEVESLGGINPLRVPTEKLPPFSRQAMVDATAGADPFRGQLEQLFDLELREGEPTRFGTFMSTGTCVMFSISPIVKPDSQRDSRWPQTTSADPAAEDELHMIGWGASEVVLAHRGRHFIATLHDHGTAYLEWLTPAATRRGLCTFEDNGFERHVVATLSAGADCEELARAPGEEIAAATEVDIDNDGRLDSIAVDGEDSGAGCGSSWRSIKLLTPGGEVEVSPRNEALMKLVGLESGPVMLLTSKGREYVYALGPQATPTVYSVTSTGVEAQCQFRIQHKRRVKTQFKHRR
jgi:hypothetical protein